MISIYGLIDPNTEQVCYVGQTALEIENRLKTHFNQLPRNDRPKSRKCLWLMDLLAQGKTPIVRLLEQCQDDEANERERYWISHYRTENPNLTNGKPYGHKLRQPVLPPIGPASNNTKDRTQEFATLARSIIEQDGSQHMENGGKLLPLAKTMMDQTGCNIDTAKRHLTKQLILMRGGSLPVHGGRRDGAGRPKN